MSGAEKMSDEQAADFAALSMAAAAGPDPMREQQEQQQAQQQAGAVDLAGEIAGLVLAFAAVARPILPCLADIYTPEVAQQAAGAVAAVCVKRGWLSGGLVGDYGEEVAAAVVLVPLGVATWQGVRRDIAALKPADQGRPVVGAGAPAEPGARSVSFGAVQHGEVGGDENG